MMYRPSLKRSKIEQIELYTKTYRPTHTEHQALRTTPACNADLAVLCTEDVVAFPTSFYEQREIPKNQAPLFTPLNYQWQQYPQQVKREIGREMEVEGVYQMGCHRELLWYFIGGVLHLWHKSERIVYRYKMHAETNCIQIGQIQSSSLHFKTRKLYIVAAGVGNQFFLFGIDKQTFAMSDLKFNYELPNSRCIQKICFLHENEIVVGSDTSHYCHFDFTAEARISCSKLSVVQRVMPFIPLLYPSAATYIQQMLVGANDFLYVLVREERPVGWLKQRAQIAINKLMMRRQTVSDTAQRKWIEVYQINRVNNTIETKQKITDHEFVQKMRSKHPQICENKNSQLLRMASIYISKQSGMLSVVTKCGYFISLNELQEVMLASSLVRAPRQSSIGVVGLYLPKRELQEESVSKQNSVAYSLGLGSLTLMNDSLWFISENALQPLKSDRVECGQILEIKPSGQRDEWLVFTKLGYYRVSRLKTYEVFISYLLVRNQLTLKFPQKSWTNEANFDLFVQSLAKMIGYENICQSLIDCLVREQTEFTVAPSILQLIDDQLRGHSNKNYRDWNHSLSKNVPVSPMKISERVGAQLWRKFLEMQSKAPKRESEQLVTRGIYCNAYWYALRNLFVRYSSPLLQIEAKNIKAKIGQVEQTIKLLQTLTKFFFLKSEKEMRQLSEAVANRNNSLKKQKSLPRSPISKLKPVVLEKKQEEATEQTVDQTIISQQQSRFTSESCIKLQQIIIKSIKRLKTLVTIFIYLADLNEAEQLSTIRHILTSRKERANVRRHLLARVVDTDRLQEFSRALPQLQLGKALQYRKWESYQQKNKKPQLANLAEIAKFISSQKLEKLKLIFESRLESLADLLLLYWDRLSAELTIISKRELLMSKQTQLLSEERSQFQAETREYLCSQMKAVELQVQEIINNVIKAYINSTQDNYPRAQQTINELIRIVSNHEDTSLLSFTENAMGNAGLAQKLILLRRIKKKTETPISSSELLFRRKLNEQRSVVQRQCMSNFEILMQNANK